MHQYLIYWTIDRIPMSDHIHIYNPTQNIIQPVTISLDNKGAGPRFGHSGMYIYI
jgi:hypothetical protein